MLGIWLYLKIDTHTMKYILFIFFSVTAYAQSDSINSSNISVVSVEKLNVVYRGINNPIKIAVPGAKSFIATAKDSALVKIDNFGNYTLRAGSGTEMKINIDATMQDNSSLHEEKKFRIMGLPALSSILNNDLHGRGSYIMTKEELSKAVVGLIYENVLIYEPNVNYGVSNFTLIIPQKHNKIKRIVVEGNKMSNEAVNELKKVKKGTIIIIIEISMWTKGIIDMMCNKIHAISVEIAD